MIPRLRRHSSLLVAIFMLDLKGILVSCSTLDRCVGQDFEGFGCRSSLVCLPSEMVCDGEVDCPDESDEEEGCRLFDDNGCKSWNGKHHVLCNSTETVCTLLHLLETCRACDRPGFWRCNDGFCIRVTKVQDGVEDCRDGSDEWQATTPWLPYVLFIITASLVFVVVILCTSLLCKILPEKMSRHLGESEKEMIRKFPESLLVKNAKESPKMDHLKVDLLSVY